jgi:hypothetical protein
MSNEKPLVFFPRSPRLSELGGHAIVSGIPAVMSRVDRFGMLSSQRRIERNLESC